MSGDSITVELTERTTLRKGLAGLRREGNVPAVIHDHGKASIHVMGDNVRLLKVYNQAGKHHPVQLKVGGKQHLALIKDVDFEPTKHTMRHVVFQAIKQNEKVSAEIPVELEGESPADKLNLLVLKQLDHVEVEALPNNLPDVLNADATKLADVGDSLSVADLIVPSGVTIMTDPTTQIAIVEMPRDQEAEANAAADALAADAEKPEAEDVPAEHGGDTPQADQAAEEDTGGKKAFQDKGE